MPLFSHSPFSFSLILFQTCCWFFFFFRHQTNDFYLIYFFFFSLFYIFFFLLLIISIFNDLLSFFLFSLLLPKTSPFKKDLCRKFAFISSATKQKICLHFGSKSRRFFNSILFKKYLFKKNFFPQFVTSPFKLAFWRARNSAEIRCANKIFFSLNLPKIPAVLLSSAAVVFKMTEDTSRYLPSTNGISRLPLTEASGPYSVGVTDLANEKVLLRMFYPHMKHESFEESFFMS